MTAIDDIFNVNGRLSQGLSSFEPRIGQKMMAELVESVLAADYLEHDDTDSKNVLLVEAETGIGKTLAYLIPAVLSGKRVVVSTATLNLQDQIVEKDIPLVEKVLDLDIYALCMKGRENYLCLYRWYQYRSNPQLSFIEDPRIEKIDSWLQNTETGDKSELSWLEDRSKLWYKIAAKSTQCYGSDCPEAGACFLSTLRRKAGKAQVLIVNHHLFFSDLALRKSGYGEIIPRYETVIFDEAHHLENVATTFFGESFSQYQILDLVNDVENQAKIDLDDQSLDLVLPKLNGLRQRIERFVALFPEKKGRFHLRSFIEDVSEEIWKEEVELLSVAIQRFAKQLKKYTQYGDTWNGLVKRALELDEKLCGIALFPGDSFDYVYWYEKRERAVVLSATPIAVADELQEYLYSQISSCVMTSATLSIGESFSYIKERLGLDDTVITKRFSTPFEYEKRTLIYIPDKSFPEPNHNYFSSRLAEEVCEILDISDGRALVLCTSFKSLNNLAVQLRQDLEYLVLCQGEASRNALLEDFKQERNSVLLAVASFWEGIDVAGDALSCVIIDKLPFEVPSDPVLQARIDRINQEGGKPFFEFQVPRAVLTLRQGVGRLMRSAQDSGVICIMDTRLYNKGYGKSFLKSLPPAPITRELLDVRDFFTRSLLA